MLNHLKIEDLLFIDIETVPQTADYNSLPENIKKLWEHKSTYFRKEDQTAEDVYAKAGIWAEFGRIICISAGFVHNHNEKPTLRVKSFYDDDEKQLLTNFLASLHTFLSKKPKARLCAHNGKEFDFPYIARRMLINNLPLPNVLDTAGSKPWEVPFVDTMELWKFGDHKHFSSLALLTTILGIPTPKDDIDGSQVAAVYYQEKNIERIVRYCEKDVQAVAHLLMRYKGNFSLLEMECV